MDIYEPPINADLADRVRHAPKILADYDVAPDFAALFPVADPTDPTVVPGSLPGYELDGIASLPPRLASLVHLGAWLAPTLLGNKLRAARVHQLADVDVFFELPPLLLRFLSGQPELSSARWLGAFLTTIDTVAARLEVGEVPVPRCVAEEVALYVAVQAAHDYRASLGDAAADTASAVRAHYPASTPARDEDLDLVLEALVGSDVRLLFDVGGYALEPDLFEAFEPHSLLHPRQWFNPYDEPLPPFGFRAPEMLDVPLGQDPTPDSVLAAAQRWLDAVVGAGTAHRPVHWFDGANRAGDWTLEVSGLDLAFLFRVAAVCHADDGLWELYGLLLLPMDGPDDCVWTKVTERAQLDGRWVGPAMAVRSRGDQEV